MGKSAAAFQRIVCCRRQLCVLAVLALALGSDGPSARAATGDEAVAYLQGASQNAVAPGGTAAPPLLEAWTRDLGGPVSYALAAGNRVFVVVGIDAWPGEYLYALDASDGHRLWGPVDLGGWGGTGYIAFANVPDRSNLAYGDGKVFVPTTPGPILAFDAATGRLAWSTRGNGLSYFDNPLLPFGAALYTVGGRPGEQVVDALRLSDGKRIWASPTYLRSSLAVDGSGVFVADSCTNVDAFDPLTGARLWQRTTSCTGGARQPLVAAGGKLYVPGSWSMPSVVLDASTGASVGSFASEAPPVIDGTTGFFRGGSILSARDLTKAQGNNAHWSFSGDGQLSGTALLVGRALYIGSRSGTLYALNADTGTVDWQGSVAGAIGQTVKDSLATGGGLLLVGSGHRLTAWRSEGASAPPRKDAVPGPAFVRPTATSGGGAVTYQLNVRHTGVLPDDPLRPPLREIWRKALGGPVSYPVIAEGKVFVTVADNRAQRWYLYAFKSRTGAKAWPRIDLGAFNEAAYHYATYDRGRLFVVSGEGNLRAIDARTGARVWSRRLPTLYAGYWMAWTWDAVPVAADGTVYLEGAGRGAIVYAIDERTGRVRWMQGLDAGSDGSFALGSRALYLVEACTTYKLSRATGSVVWVHERGCTGGSHSTPVLDAGELYVDDGFNLVLDASSGTALRGFTARTGAALAGSRAFLVAGDGGLRAEDRKTGFVAWRFDGDGRLVSAPIVVNGVVYVASEDGTVFGVRQGSGRLLWQAETGAPVRPYGAVTGLAAANGTLVVPTDGRLVAYAAP